MERFLSELAEDVLVPSKETSQIIVDWFESDRSRNNSSSNISPDSTTTATTQPTNEDDPSSSSTSTTIEPPPSTAASMGPVVTTATAGWTIDRHCRINTDNGILQTGCLQGHCLQPVFLSDDAKQEMMDYNQKIVIQGTLDGDTSKFQGGGKGPKRRGNNNTKNNNNGDQAAAARKRQWNYFQEFLTKTYGSGNGSGTDGDGNDDRNLDVVIDGANVGYYKQNFNNAPKHVDYRQIDQVVQHFQQTQGKRVLLVLHARHFSHKLMPSWAQPIVDKWAPILYKAPPGMNDDWFWLHAALWAGGKCNVVTNDEMRDHHFQMLAPRSFLRWKERNQIHFHFEARDDYDRPRELELTYPAKYSRRIQRVGNGLVIPLAKRGDVNRFLDGAHVAEEEEPEEETYICMRPTNNEKE